MIYVNTKEISVISIGDSSSAITPNQIDVGSTKVWPAIAPVVVTYDIVNIYVAYSTGTYIKADGSNYGYLTGTLRELWNGDVHSTSQVTLTASWSTTPDTTIWSISNNQIHAVDRDIMEGSARTASVRGYSSVTAQYYGPYQVTQQANTWSDTGNGRVIFTMNGQGPTVYVDAAGITLSVTDYIYREVMFTSGHTAERNPGAAYYTYEIQGNTYATIVCENGTTYTPAQGVTQIAGTGISTIQIPANTSSNQRTFTIVLRDATYSSIFAAVGIIQYGQVDWGFSFVTASPLNITSNQTSFQIKVNSTKDGIAFPITSSMVSMRNNNINASLGTITTSGTTSTLNFTCGSNSTTDLRSVYVDITQGPNTHTCRVIQAADTSAFDGITIKATSGHWVLGTVVTGTSIGIIIAKDSPITADAVAHIASIAWQFQPSAGMTPISYNDSNIAQTIPAGQTQTVGDKTYYGYWMYSPAAGGTAVRPNLQINQFSGFQVV